MDRLRASAEWRNRLAETWRAAREVMQDAAALCEIAQQNISAARALRARQATPPAALPPAGTAKGAGPSA